MVDLVCSLCGASYPYMEHRQRCPDDGEPLHVRLGRSAGELTQVNGAGLLHRWRQFLPFDRIVEDIDLGVGDTPLVRSRRLAERLGMEGLYLKNDGLNPTGSFKDRGTVAGIQRALDMGFRAVGTVSSGNMAGSMAAFAARAGLDCYVMVSSRILPEKLGPIGIYRPHLILVEGDYGDLYRESLAIGTDLGIYFIVGDDPFRVEGQKTVVLEICQQLGWETPDYIFMPVSSGGNMSGVLKGLREMEDWGIIRQRPQVVGVQAEGSSPIAKAFADGKRSFERLTSTNTICGAITNPNPPSGNRVLRWLEGGSFGRVMTVTDDEALAAQKELAELEGIWVQPDSAVTVAAIRKSLQQGMLEPSARTVAILTGNGLKDTSIFKRSPVETRQVPLERLRELVTSLAAR